MPSLELLGNSAERLTDRAGIEVGSLVRMSHIPRQRERRAGLGELLGAIVRGLDRRSDISLLRGAFEDMVRRMMPVRTVQLREVGSRWATRPDDAGPESIVIDVPGSAASCAGLLEATFDPACGINEWDFQLLGHAANLGALVLEVERMRLQLARAGLLVVARAPRRAGAAP